MCEVCPVSSRGTGISSAPAVEVRTGKRPPSVGGVAMVDVAVSVELVVLNVDTATGMRAEPSGGCDCGRETNWAKSAHLGSSSVDEEGGAMEDGGSLDEKEPNSIFSMLFSTLPASTPPGSEGADEAGEPSGNVVPAKPPCVLVLPLAKLGFVSSWPC